MSQEIKVGDVCLDLAQGRPVQVVQDTQQTVAEWSNDHDYQLQENYGNQRFDTGPNDRVYDVVYCNNIQSQPSKTYAFPDTRLARVEVEAADRDLYRVQDEIRIEALAAVFDSMQRYVGLNDAAIDAVARHVNGVHPAIVDEALELAEASRSGSMHGGPQDDIEDALEDVDVDADEIVEELNGDEDELGDFQEGVDP